MAKQFPGLPRMPRRVLFGAIAIGVAGIALAWRTTATSLDWIGTTFPGFMVLDNRVIASVGLPGWQGPDVPGLYQSQVVAVDGEPVTSREDIRARIAARAPGTPVRYRLARGDAAHEVTLPTQRFTARDWTLLFGVFLLNGVTFFGTGLAVWVAGGGTPLARAVAVFAWTWAVFMLTALDLYGPATFFRLHVVGEAFIPGTLFHFVLLFPAPHPRARWRFAAYPLCLASALVYQTFLYEPAVYSRTLAFNMIHLGIMSVLFATRLLTEYWRSRSHLARQRIRMVTIGALLGLALPGALSLITAFGFAINVGALTPPLFILALAYAVVKHDVFALDTMVKRGAYYLVVTGAVGAAYGGSVLLFNLVLRAGAVMDSPAFPVLFTIAVLLIFDPLRARLQAGVDRVFFGSRYDAAEVLAAVGEEMGSALQRDDIAGIVRRCVDGAIPNAGTRLVVDDDGERRAGLPPGLAAPLAAGRVVTAFDPPELYPDAASHASARAALHRLGAEIAVPLQLRGALLGALAVGPKRSGLFYTAGDAEFLRALAHAAAIALQNASSYEALARLNAELESRVRERTAQLVQSEKLASLGRLVAGVAHEINNPVSFVAGAVGPLRERIEEAMAAAPGAQAALEEAGELVDIMARGAERTVAIVKDLRSFSRLGEEERKPADLHEGLDVTLRLLEARWRDRIAIHRDYGPLPLVECNAGQVNQVFMNVLANACDAIRDRGTIWITTRVEDEAVRVTIRDDGPGIAPEIAARIFEPFFTTKDVGHGTGLGLAISHGVVTAHGGRIEVESAAGAGATFHVVLPVGTAARLDRAASSGR